MENSLKGIDDRLYAIGENDDGTIFVSPPRWHPPGKRVGKANVLRPPDNLHRWRTHCTPERIRDGLLDRIKRKLGLG